MFVYQEVKFAEIIGVFLLNMVDINNLQRPVLNDNLKSILATNNSFGNLPWLFYLIIGLVVLCLILFIIWIFRRLKLKSFPLEVKSLLDSGDASLAIGDIDSAKSIYLQLKKIAEDSKDSEVTRKTLEFYNKLYKSMSK